MRFFHKIFVACTFSKHTMEDSNNPLRSAEEYQSFTLFRKAEYSKTLSYALYPPLYQGLRQIWDAAKKEAKTGHVYETFQEHLRNIPKWNQDLIEKVYQKVVENIRFENASSPAATAKLLEDLITRVFLLTTEILAGHTSDDKILVKVPPGSRFVHHCYKECARRVYENALLMEDRPQYISSVDRLKNLQKCNKLIIASIDNTVRRLLPLESLLDQKPARLVGRHSQPNDSQSPVRSRSITPTSRSRSRSKSRGPSPTPPPTHDISGLFESESEADEQDHPPRGRSPPPDSPRPTSESSDDTMTVRFGGKPKSQQRSVAHERTESGSDDSEAFTVPHVSKKAPSVIDTNDLPNIAKKDESTFDFSKQESPPSLDKEFDALNFFDDA